jgi:hypothetical protein
MDNARPGGALLYQPINRRTGAVLKIAWIAVAVVCFVPATLTAQRFTYFGAMGGVATLSGDGSAVVTAQSASTSLFSPMNGGAADIFFGVHLFSYVSVQADYVWSRNDVVLVSNQGSPGTLSFYRQPQELTQNAFLANVLVYFRKRGSRIRPYLSEGVGGVLIRSRSSGGGVSGGNPALLPGSSDHASVALRTSVGLDVRLLRCCFFRYSFGETLTRNTFGDQLSPPEHRIPKNFQNLFGVYYQF